MSGEISTKDFLNMIEGRLVVGSPPPLLKGIATPQEPLAGHVVFVFSEEGVRSLIACAEKPALIVCPSGDEFVERLSGVGSALATVEKAEEAFIRALHLFNPYGHPPAGISPQAMVAPSARIGRQVSIGPFVYVGEEAQIGDGVVLYPYVYVGKGVKIGNNTVIYPGAVLYEGTVVGTHCIIHAGVVLGADGFGYVQRDAGKSVKIPQIGRVVIGDYVEIGACTTIDRATVGATMIGSGTKVDNHVHIAHNVRIGEDCVIVGQVGIAGTATIGKGVMIGGQAGIKDHVVIADGVKIAARSAVNHSIRKKGAVVSGAPAVEHARSRRIYAVYKNLPELARKLHLLEKRIEALEKKNSSTNGEH